MDTTIIYDAARKAQVIQPQTGDLLSTIALLAAITLATTILFFAVRLLMQKRVAKEYHVVYKQVQQDLPAIQKLRSWIK